jgi:thioredoxin reductase
VRTTIEVAIIGAGPYGLSIAAHLRARGVGFRIFGSPMHTWRTQMPKGMRLKSEGFASALYDPDSAFTLAHYCKQEGIPYADIGHPVQLEAFSSYGLEFQKRFVPELEDKLVASLERSAEGFQIRLVDGEVFSAQKVISAIGICHYQYLPPVLADLPEEFVTHTSRHSALDRFKGREVAVIGAGSSAVDVAGLAREAGASVQLIARMPVIRFHDPPGPIPRPFLDRVRAPMTGLGPGWRSLFCTSAPLLFHQMPEKFRLEVVRRHLGPASGWFSKEKVVGHVPFHLGCNVKQVNIKNGRVHLHFSASDGGQRELVTDHVIAGTGYRVDLRRLSFLNSEFRAGIRSVNDAPVLSLHFESSIPGLYFVGASSANSFGPLVRFLVGAQFTARRLSRHLARSLSRRLVQGVSVNGTKTVPEA